MQSAVKQLMAATVETASTPTVRASGVPRRARGPQAPPPPSRWIIAMTHVLAKLRTRRSWVAAMFVLGTFDVILNLVNFVQLSSDELDYGLVIGPPTQELWTSMCVFTVFGTLLYIPETINTFSVLYSAQGETIVPIHFELPVTLLLEHIPLAATDYFVARCRREYTTGVQTTCGAVRLVFIFVRLIWYAHIEGKKIKRNDKYEIRQVLVMTSCLLFAVAIAFPIMNWRYEPDGALKPHHLENVSIHMLRKDKPPQAMWFSFDWTVEINEQGWSAMNTSLVRSAWPIYLKYKDHKEKGTSRSLHAVYDCRHTKKFRPPECERHRAKALLFSFEYSSVTTTSPYGEIGYNYAELCAEKDKSNWPKIHDDDYEERDADDIETAPFFPDCYQPNHPLTGGWRLFYFETHRWYDKKETRINVSQPFRKTYTSPMPKFKSVIEVCHESTGGNYCRSQQSQRDAAAMENDGQCSDDIRNAPDADSDYAEK